MSSLPNPVPEEYTLPILSSIHRLSHVFRYSSLPVVRRESVAEHTLYVSLYSLILAKKLVKLGFEVDIGKLLERALVHDVDESMTGDFLRTVKYGHPDLKRILDEVSVSMIRRMENELDVEILQPWTDAKSEGIEGDIISFVDLACVLAYAFEELRLGNASMKHVVYECCDYILKLVSERKASPVMRFAKSVVAWATKEVTQYA